MLLCAPRIDEQVWLDAAACCSTSALTTRSHRHRRELRHIDTLPRLRGLPCTAVGYLALPWLLGPVERELFASGGRLALGIDGPGIGPDYGAL